MTIKNLFNRKKNNEKTDSFNSQKEQQPSTRDYYAEGVVLYDAGHYTKAVEFFQAAIEENSGNEASYLKLADSYTKIGKEEQAKKTLLALLNINPSNQAALQMIQTSCISVKKVSDVQEISPQIPVNIPEGALNGSFSVSPSVKVRFSKGNLQYKAQNNSYHFAEHQYEIIGENNSLISRTNNNYIDLFCWGTSGFNSLFPYIGDIGNLFMYECGGKDITSTRHDWGINNAIDNGGNKCGLWRTLSKQEWEYLLFNRHSARRLYAFGTIAGVCGLLLMPDDYTGNDISIDSEEFTSNVFTEEQWQHLEIKGVVFLPCAGHRGSGTKIYHINVSGRYWSTTYANPWAYMFCVENKYITVGSELCESGISVRLVTNI